MNMLMAHVATVCLVLSLVGMFFSLSSFTWPFISEYPVLRIIVESGYKVEQMLVRWRLIKHIPFQQDFVRRFSQQANLATLDLGRPKDHGPHQDQILCKVREYEWIMMSFLYLISTREKKKINSHYHLSCLKKMQHAILMTFLVDSYKTRTISWISLFIAGARRVLTQALLVTTHLDMVSWWWGLPSIIATNHHQYRCYY